MYTKYLAQKSQIWLANQGLDQSSVYDIRKGRISYITIYVYTMINGKYTIYIRYFQ